ncbi:MAG: hemolysin XhlA family protein [Sporolactobacillus sp.]
MEDSERLDKLEDRVGLIERRMDVAENDIKDIKEDIRQIKDNTTWTLRLLLGAIATAVITGAIGIILASVHIG